MVAYVCLDTTVSLDLHSATIFLAAKLLGTKSPSFIQSQVQIPKRKEIQQFKKGNL